MEKRGSKNRGRKCPLAWRTRACGAQIPTWWCGGSQGDRGGLVTVQSIKASDGTFAKA
jgi:hypothetical protein